MSILGTDHSRWDWTGTDGITGGLYYIPISFDLAKRNGSSYAFLKACDGASDTPFYKEAIRDARAAGLLAAPYVWLYPRNHTAPEKQAEFWYSRLSAEPLIVIDFEAYATYYPTYDDLYNAIEKMRGLGYTGRIMIYTGHYYWASYGSTANYWKQFPVWLARYSTEPPQPTPPWDGWTFWQYTANGDAATYGVNNGKHAVDLNTFEGTFDELAALFGAAMPPQEETMYKVKIIAPTLNVRSGPSTNAAILRQLKAGNIVYTPFAKETKPVSGGEWIRISESPVEYVAVGAALSSVEAVPGGGALPVINFHLTAEGYPAQDVAWTPS